MVYYLQEERKSHMVLNSGLIVSIINLEEFILLTQLQITTTKNNTRLSGVQPDLTQFSVVDKKRIGKTIRFFFVMTRQCIHSTKDNCYLRVHYL